jgi:hypothetical protein
MGNPMKTIHGLLAASAISLLAAQPAMADQIKLEGWWGGAGSAHIDFNGINYHTGLSTSVSEYGGSGGFSAADLTTGGPSFEAWCVDIFSNFWFPSTSNNTLLSASSVFNATKADDLGRLYTAHHTLIDGHGSTSNDSAAFQLAVWEIVNESGSSYDLSNGAFTATGTGAADAQSWLSALGSTTSMYSANVWRVDSMVSTDHGHSQDVVVFAPVPEPETYAMLLAGLGLMSVTAYRRKKQAA